MSALVHFSRARRELELATTFDEVKAIRDKAEAMRVYVKQAHESLEMQNMCAEIKIRAERKAGELLAENLNHEGGRPEKVSHDVTVLQPKLSELGISKMESSRWQSIASIPTGDFEGYIAQNLHAGTELTTAGALRLAKSLTKTAKIDGFKAANPVESAFSDLETIIASGQKFRTIYADPPWQYDNQGTRAATNNHYPTMTPEEIAALPINRIAEPEAHLHVWTTNAFLFDTKAIIEAWGFEYKSVFVWVKPNFGIGNYWRVAHEFLILGVRGGLPFLEHDRASWLQHERTRHSEKPGEIRRIIESVSPGPRIELFAREHHAGWAAWGNEVNGNTR